MAVQGTNVTVNLPSIDDLLKNLGPAVLRIGIQDAASTARGVIIDNWSKGVGANYASLQNPGISDKWRKQKTKLQRKPWIDLNVTGGFYRDFQVRDIKADSARVGWNKPEELDKARHNYGWRPQMLTVGSRLIAQAVGAFNKWIRKNTRGLK